MDVMALIDRIEESMDSGRSVPLMRGRLVDIEKVYEIIDEIRGNFPDELKQARWIVKERQEMLEEAEKEANRILEEARPRRVHGFRAGGRSSRRRAGRIDPR